MTGFGNSNLMTHLVPLDGTTPVSLTLPEGLAYDAWRDTLHAYARLGKASQWWIGDALKYGEDHFGEEFAQAVSDLGYSEESLRGMLWVASRVAPNVRRPTLSWSAHQVVAALPPDQQTAFLATAEREGWTVKQLRETVKGPPKPKAVCGYPECPMREEEA
jgi:hypothetical protein